MKINPKVSIIILNWNGLKDTIDCLESLKKIACQNYEVVVVDNGSKGNDAVLLEERYKDYITLIKNKDNLGFTGGNNKAIRAAKGEYIVLLNNDTKVDRNWLEELVKAADGSEGNIGMFQSKLLNYVNPGIIDSTGHKKIFAQVIDRGMGEKDKGQFDKKKEIFGVCAASALYKREMLEEIGLFDEAFFSIFEDVDLDFRAKKAGYKAVFVPESIVYHKRGVATLEWLPSCSELAQRNFIIVAKRWFSVPDKLFLTLWYLIEIFRNFLKIIFRLDTLENIAIRKKNIRKTMGYIFQIWTKEKL